jgi:excisionase family DNA binding protein
MNEIAKNPGDAFLEAIRFVVREEIQAFKGIKNSEADLLTAEELAERLKVPVSWVYEQSRQGKIPTHRMGRYIRFRLQEVVDSQKKN